MHDIDISNLNLNLLPALEALLIERSVSRAARRIGVSQPAMSHTLARLREELDDPLLVLSGRRMQLTPRAEAIGAPLSEALRALRTALTPDQGFDPATATRAFTISTFDLFELIMLPELLAYLATVAPTISLRIERITDGTMDRLQRGDIDLLLCGPDIPLATSGLEQRKIREDGYSVVARDGTLPRRLTLARYLAADHILVSISRNAEGLVDRQLRPVGQERHVALVVPHFMSALALAAGSDSLLTLPTSAAKRGCELFDLCLRKPPLELPRVSGLMVWPARLHHDEGHQWLRGVIAGDAR